MRPFDEPSDLGGPGEPAPEPISPEDFVTIHRGIPPDARRMGLDRNSEEGAMVALAGSLDPTKLSHKVVAWLLLSAFLLPSVAAALRYLV